MAKIEMRKTYRTKNGLPIRIICIDLPGECPVVGCDNEGTLYTWTSEGYNFEYQHYELTEVASWAECKLDDPVLVRNDGGEWIARHFAGVKNGDPHVWIDGKTSHTCNNNFKNYTQSWDECIPATPENMKYVRKS